MTSQQAEARLARLELDNERLRRSVEELSVVNDVTTATTSSRSVKEIIDLIVQKCVKHLRVEQGAVQLFDDKPRDEEAAALKTVVRRVGSGFGGLPIRLSDQITGWMLRHKSPLTINDLANDDRFRYPLPAGVSVRNLLCVPLRAPGRMIGVLSVFNKQGQEGFTDGDQRLLAIIGAQSAQVIEAARLYEEEKMLQVMRRDMEVAHEIQMNLLPKAPPAVQGYEIAGKTLAAQNVGGDYFDYLLGGSGEVAICLGDVSGKGMPAALLMANVQATIRGQHLVNPAPSECMVRANQLLYQSTDAAKFVTFFYGILEPQTGRFRFTNAGHNPPIVISRDAAIKHLESGGPVLGALPAFPYQEDETVLNPGDALVIYSDGISEAMNATNEEFGEDRLEQMIVDNRYAGSHDLIDRIFHAVHQHSVEVAQSDDMTIVVVRRD